MKKSSHRWPIVVLALALLTALLGYRIWDVNQHRVTYPIQHYSMGQEVPLDGDFLDYDGENTQGYYVNVQKAEVMDSNEYLARYAPDVDPGSMSNGPGDVIVLTYDVRNDGNTDGYLNMVSLFLVGENKNTFYKVDSELWEASEPRIRGNSNGLVLVPNTSYTTHLPLSCIQNPKFLEYTLDTKNYTRKNVREHSFELVLTNDPTRKIIDINVGQ